MFRAITATTCAIAVGCGAPEEPPPDDACRFATEADAVTPGPLSTPRWAFRPWIAKDISNADDTRAFVEGFRARDIPVGAVILDSPWATHYNTFVVNDARYPDFPGLLDELHAQDIRVVLWTTQMVNRTGLDFETGGDTYEGPAPHYEEGKRCGFFVDDGADYLWWKGLGAASTSSIRRRSRGGTASRTRCSTSASMAGSSTSATSTSPTRCRATPA